MRKEKEILKEFELLGYEIDNRQTHCRMISVHNEKIIEIDKIAKLTGCFRNAFKPHHIIVVNGVEIKTENVNTTEPCWLTTTELKLLNELYTIWGWIE